MNACAKLTTPYLLSIAITKERTVMVGWKAVSSNRWAQGGGLFLAGAVSGGATTLALVMGRKKQDSTKEPGVGGWRCVKVVSAGVSATALLVYLTRRLAYPKADHVFNKVLPLLRANGEVRQLLGGHLQPGQFRAYAYTGGLKFTRSLPFLSWKNRQLEMMFQVYGEQSSAMVSLNCSPRLLGRGAGVGFKSLAVDLPNGERIVLQGQPQDVVFKGYTRLR